MPLVAFETPRKHQQTKGLLMFSGGIERDQWHEMGTDNIHIQLRIIQQGMVQSVNFVLTFESYEFSVLPKTS